MSISVESYALPDATELPSNRLPWTPDADRAVLLVHDMQEYFLRFYAVDQQPMATAMNNMQALLHACRQRGVPVVYTAQPADPATADRKLLKDLWGPGLTAFPEQAGITPRLAPVADDLVLAKTRYSAFHQTTLHAHMRERGRDQLWICGVYAHIGCMITAFDAFMHDIQPFLAQDAVMDFSRAYHEHASRMVSERCGVVTVTDHLLRSLEHHASSSSVQTSWAQRVADAAIARLITLEHDTSPDAELRDLGLDSVRMMELLESLRAGGVLVETVSLLECQSLSELYQVVRSAPVQAVHPGAAP